MNHYQKIAEAITFIKENHAQQPSLETIAEHVNLSPFHFQRLFKEWAGVSPKVFLQYITLNHAKRLLSSSQKTLFDTAAETGLSGTGRLHDLFLKIEGMTPGEYKNGGEGLNIEYSFAESQFGDVIVASTPKGICHLTFYADKENAAERLKSDFPNAVFAEQYNELHQRALQFFRSDGDTSELKLHLKCTSFQLKVWEALLQIPAGELTTYGKIAGDLQNPNASRAVGTAIGGNPVAYLIPCHRVIQNSGGIGGYMWGTTRKTAIIGWEAARRELRN